MFEQSPGTVLVRGSLLHKDNPLLGTYLLFGECMKLLIRLFADVNMIRIVLSVLCYLVNFPLFFFLGISIFNILFSLSVPICFMNYHDRKI